MSRAQVVQVFLALERGQHLDMPFVEYYKAPPRPVTGPPVELDAAPNTHTHTHTHTHPGPASPLEPSMPLSTRSARGAIQTPRRAERGALTAGARAAGQCSEVVWEPLCDDGLLDVDPPPSLLLPLPMSLLYTP